MPIEKFTKAHFEYALPKSKQDDSNLWASIGIHSGEETYQIPVRPGVIIMVRSSVGTDGVAADSGKDSIRCWLTRDDYSPMGNKIQSHISRVPGWQERMTTILRELWKRGVNSGDCPKCHKPLSIFKVKKDGENKGRLFVKCWDCTSTETFRWLDEEIPADHGKPRFEQIEPVDEKFVKIGLDACKFKKDKLTFLREYLKKEVDGSLWALNRIYAEQTVDEQAVQRTCDLNKVGFTGVDGEILSSFAEQYRANGSLSPKQLILTQKKMPKYAKQLIGLMAA